MRLTIAIAQRLILLSALWILVAASGTHASDSPPHTIRSDTPGPRTVVESLHAVLIDCMKGACGPEFQGRYQRIVAQLDETFDLAFMARISIGKAWRTLSPEERTTYFELSRRLSAANYASNFDSYAGQHFETLGEEPAARGTILVKTEFVQPSDDNVRFDYRLRQSDDRWLIIDITLDGKISEMALRRADYGSVIKREGFAKLVGSLEKKLAKLEKE